MTKKTGVRTVVWLLILLMAVPPGVFAQSGDTSPAPIFRQEELDQMLAPIALYPDSLLVQVLMAATYPIEVVEADRWFKANRNLTGDQFADALDQQDWDPSVKSLVNFPSVLAMMDERLGWTQKLGDAFLSQKDQVMDTVQKLRAAARAQGTLQDTSQQRIIADGQAIAIESVNPQVIYVPVYDPYVVYGPWWYPTYPPYRYYPPGAILTGAIISFGLGVFIGAAWGYAWGGFGWRRHEVSVNVYRNVHMNPRINRTIYVNRVGGGGRGDWQHDPGHRRGVVYRDINVGRQFGQPPRGNAEGRRGFRGYNDDRGRPVQDTGRPAAQPRDVPGRDRPAIQGREVPARDLPRVQERRTGPTIDRPAGQERRAGQIPDRPASVQPAAPQGAFSGIDRGGQETRTQSDRGRASRESRVSPRPAAVPAPASSVRPSAPEVSRPGSGSMSRPSSGPVVSPGNGGGSRNVGMGSQGGTGTPRSGGGGSSRGGGSGGGRGEGGPRR